MNTNGDLAHVKAKQLAQQGHIELAEPWFINVLSRKVNDMEVLRDFSTTIWEHADKFCGEQPHHVQQQLDGLLQFLVQRIPVVQPENLTEVLRLIEVTRKKKPTGHLQQDMAVEVQSSEEVLSRFQHDFPMTIGNLQHALEELEVLPMSSKRDELFQKFSALLAVERGLVEAWNKMLALKTITNPSSAAYVLASVDSLIRNIYQVAPLHDSDILSRIEKLQKEVEEQTSLLSIRKRAEEAQKYWDTWNLRFENSLSNIEDWVIPEKGQADKACQKRILLLQKIAVALQGIFVHLQHTSIENKANTILSSLTRQLSIASEAQQRQYNVYAMKKIKEAYNQGCKQLGLAYDDKEKIGDVLIKKLGNIDQRFLTTEVLRSYNEVFDYFLNKMSNPGGKKEDFTNKSNKLYVLQKMSNQKKTKLEAF